MGHLNFGKETCDQMIRAFDSAKNRKLNMEEFGRLHVFLVNVQNSFFAFDKDRSGSLCLQEVQQALQQAGGWRPGAGGGGGHHLLGLPHRPGRPCVAQRAWAAAQGTAPAGHGGAAGNAPNGEPLGARPPQALCWTSRRCRR
jgi:hypothetical protein